MFLCYNQDARRRNEEDNGRATTGEGGGETSKVIATIFMITFMHNLHLFCLNY